MTEDRGTNRGRKRDARVRSREKLERSCEMSVEQLMNMVIQSARAEERRQRSVTKARASIRCTMFKVPEPIRQVSRESYNPRLISFGLYNRIDERWAPMEKVKQEVASARNWTKKDVQFRALDQKAKANLIWEHLCDNVLSRDKGVSSDQFWHYIWKVYDDPPPELSSTVVKHLLVLDAIFLVSFMIFLQTDPRSKSIVLRGFQSYQPLLRIFTRAGILCNLNMIAGDIWLFENQIPLSLVRKMVRQMYIRDTKSGRAGTEKAAAETAFGILVRETVMRAMRVLPGDYRNERMQGDEESDMDMVFRSVKLRKCNHLLQCLYRTVCPQTEQQRTKKRKRKGRSDLEQVVMPEEKSLGSGRFESHWGWGNALVRQHSMFQFTSSESVSLRSVFTGLSQSSSFNDAVQSVKSGKLVGKIHSIFTYPSPSREIIGAANDTEENGRSVRSEVAPDQNFSKLLEVPEISEEHEQNPPMKSSCDLKALEQIIVREEVTLMADRDITESCRVVPEAGVRESTNELSHLQISRQEDIVGYIPANGLVQPLDATPSFHYSLVQSQEHLTLESWKHPVHETGFTARTVGTENITLSTGGISDFSTHEIVQPVWGPSSASASRRESSRHSLSFRYMSRSLHRPNTHSPRIKPTSSHAVIDMNVYTLPTLSQLREVGVRVIGDSYPGCKVDLKRSSWPWESSTLHISQLNVDGNTERFLRNLIAFELVGTSEHKLLTYLQCLDDLINNDEDVRHLKGGNYPVILNCSMNERDVARMFNRMLLNCTVYHNEELQEIRRKVRSYYLQQWRRSWTEFRERYCACSKPWVVVSLMVGFLLLCMTALQTTYTVLGNYH